MNDDTERTERDTAPAADALRTTGCSTGGCDDDLTASELTAPMRRIVALVAGLNLLGFVVELTAAILIGSVALFADAADFLEDVLINTLVLLAVTWPVASRRRAAYILAGLILLPAAAALGTAVWRILTWEAPEPLAMSGIGVFALAVNLACAALLMRLRSGHGALGRGAWLAARNDALGNVLIIVAGLITLLWFSPVPDIVVGLLLTVINLGAAKEVLEQARAEDPALELDED